MKRYKEVLIISSFNCFIEVKYNLYFIFFEIPREFWVFHVVTKNF